MSVRFIRSVVTTVTILSFVSAAHAVEGHVVGRYLGMGWNDGYHSHTACPPKKQHHYFHMPVAAAKPVPTPWWKLPATDAEMIGSPTPAQPTSGPSLFRQPGEGSSVHPPGITQP